MKKENNPNPLNLHGPSQEEAAKLNSGDFTDSRLSGLVSKRGWRIVGAAAGLGTVAALGADHVPDVLKNIPGIHHLLPILLKLSQVSSAATGEGQCTQPS